MNDDGFRLAGHWLMTTEWVKGRYVVETESLRFEATA